MGNGIMSGVDKSKLKRIQIQDTVKHREVEVVLFFHGKAAIEFVGHFRWRDDSSLVFMLMNQ